MCLILPVGCSVACADAGLADVGTVVLVAGNDGIGGVLPGRGVPLLTLKHVSPVQGSPPRILFCCLVSSVWYASSMFSVLPLLLLAIVLLKFSNLSVGTGHRWSGTKSAFRCVLCALTRYPWLLSVQRSFLFLRTSMPVGVKVTGLIFAVVPWVV